MNSRPEPPPLQPLLNPQLLVISPRETPKPLSLGTYTVKLVIHDIGDSNVDSALFVETESLKLFPLAKGDYNGDGCVNTADYTVWKNNYGKPNPTFFDGDGNGDCLVNAGDYVHWRNNLGNSGNGHFAADFNRDGCVDSADLDIWTAHSGMTHCASRFEGDADGDGDVDAADHAIWQSQDGSCGGCPQGLMAMSGPSLAELLPKDPDVNGDGEVDDEDFAALDKIIAAAENGGNSLAKTSQSGTDGSGSLASTDSATSFPTLAASDEDTGTALPPQFSRQGNQSVLIPNGTGR